MAEVGTRLWRTRFHARLAGQGRPVWRSGADVVTGSELWEASRRWADLFLTTGLAPGDRLVVALPAGPAFVEVVIAAFTEGLTVVPMPVEAGFDPAATIAAVDPTVAVAVPGHALPWAFTVDGRGGPVAEPGTLRASELEPTPSARVLLPGSVAGGRVALSDRNLETALDATLVQLRWDRSRWLSVLDWTRADGFVLDLLLGLLGPDEVVRADDPGDAGQVDLLIQRALPTHVAAQVGQLRAWIDEWGGAEPLGAMEGMGCGPGVDQPLASALSRTRLRPQRGSAEFSGMAMMGAPGVWRVGLLGRAVGCRVSPAANGTVVVGGENVAFGSWGAAGLHLEDPNRTITASFS